eukprot:CAMPEP_0170567802 /NCGR_PEP_ID=MMETSP0211-20121228/80717_1 /TAXON_ID=311385 /ORGANISM="Pseudokeronopsis sp., Strain OXSARD2" /LENGTH=108 /DNA_ID=CAMNT_0010889371 /DNA_START=2170 /DNA_END=2496 /DNA_ORIENTATION=-
MSKKVEGKSGADKNKLVGSNVKKGNVTERPVQSKTAAKVMSQSPHQVSGGVMFQQRKDSAVVGGKEEKRKTKVLKSSIMNENSESMKEKRQKAAAKFGGFGQRKSSEI